MQTVISGAPHRRVLRALSGAAPAFLLAVRCIAGDVIWPLTEDGRYLVQISERDGKIAAYLRHSAGAWSHTDPRFVQAMRDGLSVVVDGTRIPVVPLDGEAPAPSGWIARAKKIRVNLSGNQLARIEPAGASSVVREQTTLTTYDVRKFSSNASYGESFKPQARYAPRASMAMRTDLHTHLAGHLEFQSLVKLGIDGDVQYPTELLDKINVRYPEGSVKDGKISFRTLVRSREFRESHGMAALEDAMTIEKSRVRTFLDMEEKYAFRGPITKDPKLFKDMLWEVARTCQKSGIRYTEQSLSNILDPEWLQTANEEVPRIEAQLGVKIRFVAGLWRHSDPEWNLDEITRLKRLVRSSPYIVGVDFMGHETNATSALESQIKAAAKIRRIPGLEYFQIRVHGGENPLSPGNVGQAAEYGATRVGHGLYIEKDPIAMKLDAKTAKINPKVLASLKGAGTIVEINPASNLALNNLSGGTEVLLQQFRQFKKASIPVVIGSDGVGMYGADHPEIDRMLRQNGFTDADFRYSRRSERAYEKRIEAQTQARVAALRKSGEPIPTRAELEAYVDRQGRQFTPEVEAQRSAQSRARVERFRSDFEGKGIKAFDSAEFEGKQVIDVSGGSMKQFKEMREAGRFHELNTERVRAMFRDLLPKLDPDKVYFQTGGTQFGYEAILHEEVARYNAEAVTKGLKPHRVVGVLPMEANPEEVAGPAKGGITDYKLAGKSWADFSMHKLEALTESGGLKLLFGGNMFVADEARRVINADLPFKTLYFADAAGASGDLARELPAGAFKNVDDLVRHISAGPNAPVLRERAAVGGASGNACVKSALRALLPRQGP